jgi:hypothetical protein
MHRSARELWLWGATKVGEFSDWNDGTCWQSQWNALVHNFRGEVSMRPKAELDSFGLNQAQFALAAGAHALSLVPCS